MTDPSKTDAYIELVNYLRTDTLTKEEADGLNQLQAGLDRKNSNGYGIDKFDSISQVMKYATNPNKTEKQFRRINIC